MKKQSELTYRISLKFTCPYISSRNGGDAIVSEGLSLKQAKIELLDLFNECYELNCKHWGLAVVASKNRIEGANRTRKDGTRSFEYDSRVYSIELDN